MHSKNFFSKTILVLVILNTNFLYVAECLKKNKYLPECLQSAAINNDIDTIKKYIKDGGNINATSCCFGTLLAIAAFEGNKKIVQFLIDSGAKVDFHDNTSLKFTPLTYAADHGDPVFYKDFADCVEILLNHGADIEHRSFQGTPLIHAVENERIEVVKVLIRRGADIFAKDRDGKTAFEIAMEKYRYWCKQYEEGYFFGLHAAIAYKIIASLIFEEIVKQNFDLVCKNQMLENFNFIREQYLYISEEEMKNYNLISEYIRRQNEKRIKEKEYE